MAVIEDVPVHIKEKTNRMLIEYASGSILQFARGKIQMYIEADEAGNAKYLVVIGDNIDELTKIELASIEVPVFSTPEDLLDQLEWAYTVAGAPVSGVTLDTINGDLVAVYTDPNRSNRILSVAEWSYSWGENALSDNDWFIPNSNASDADSGHIVKRDGIITFAALNCENANNNAKGVELWINTTLHSVILTTVASTGYQQVINDTLEIEVNKGDRLRLRTDTAGGNINDTVVTLSGHFEKR